MSWKASKVNQKKQKTSGEHCGYLISQINKWKVYYFKFALRTLQETLLDFLTCSRLMLERTEMVLLETRVVVHHRSTPSAEEAPFVAGPVPGSISQSNLKTGASGRVGAISASQSNIDISATRAPDSNAMSTMWMSEMQREFNGLVDIIIPLLQECAAEKKPKKFPPAGIVA